MKNSAQIRTDLALEAADTGDGKLPRGVFTDEQSKNGITTTRVEIRTAAAARRLGRSPGNYLTLAGDLEAQEAFSAALTRALGSLLPAGEILVVGLGNPAITPDALGPKVAAGVIATRHFPPAEREAVGLAGLREVCTLSPGVMGETGLEVQTVVAALCKAVPFAAVVAVDALAARSPTRLGSTVQLSNTGIAPGSGIGNRRSALDEKTLGIPVFSLGIPTVIDAATLLEAKDPLFVTPRNIDRLIAQGAKLLSYSLNCALQPSLSPETVTALMA